MKRSLRDIEENYKKASREIDEFQRASKEANGDLLKVGHSLVEKILKGQHLSADDGLDVSIINKYATKVIQRFQETAKIYMALNRQNFKEKFGEHVEMANALFAAHVKDLGVLKEQLALAYADDDHKVKHFVTILNEKLKQENQIFNQFLQLEKLEDDREKEQHAHQLQLRDQAMKEAEAANKMWRDNWVTKQDMQLKQTQAANDK